MNFLDNRISKCIFVGKTNVGKSTLFNCLSDKNISIAHMTPGATRDCIIRQAEFFGQKLELVDSGGIEASDTELASPFQELVSQKVRSFIKEQASLVVFVVSAKDGLTKQDLDIAKMVRQLGKPTLFVVNKVDHAKSLPNAHECFSLGFNDPILVSAAQKQGLSQLKKRILSELGLKPKIKTENAVLSLVEDGEERPTNQNINIAVIGKPNSGKSTFVNAILNEERVLTSEMAGTTVDAVDTFFSYAGKDICLIDTAGIRKQRSIYEDVEKMAVARALCAVDRANVAVLMINAKDGITEQDKKIAGIIFEKKKACLIAINKWDENITESTNKTKFTDDLRFHLPFLAYAPVVFLSALHGYNIFDVIDITLKLAPRFSKRINTSKLNRALEKAQAAHPAPAVMGRPLKFYFATQIDTAPPTFAISCSKPGEVNYSYKRYLTNYFRNNLALAEIPIRLVFRSKKDSSAFKRDN